MDMTTATIHDTERRVADRLNRTLLQGEDGEKDEVRRREGR